MPWRRIRTGPPPWAVLLGLAGLAFAYYPDFYAYRIGVYDELMHADAKSLRMVRLVYLAGVAACLGCYRVYLFHPLSVNGYGDWLTRTAWQHPQPLPLGPLRPTWFDLLLVVAMTLAAAAESGRLAVCVPAAWLGAQGLLLTLVLVLNGALGRDAPILRSVAPVAFLLPLAAVLRPQLVAAPLVALAIYVAAWWATRRFLARFPWNTNFWTLDPARVLRERAARSLANAGPYPFLLPDMPAREPTWPDSLLGAALAGWIAFCFIELCTRATPPMMPHDIRVAVWFFGGVAALARLSRFYAGVLPPMSFRARIKTGHILIPAHDSAVISPLIVFCIIAGGEPFLLWAALPFPCCVGLPVFLAVIAILKFAPSVAQWRATGAYHVIRATPRPGRIAARASARNRISLDPPVSG